MDATTGALIVAALSVIATPITAWLTFRWGRDQERERTAGERLAESDRWQREEVKRRQLRGEEAAGRLLEVIDDAAMVFTSNKAKQEDLKPTYHEVRRLSELLTDDATRDKIFLVAKALYFFHSATMADQNLGQMAIGTAFSDAAHAVIRSYLLERPLPETPRFDRLLEIMEEGSQMYAEEMEDEDFYDPLAATAQ